MLDSDGLDSIVFVIMIAVVIVMVFRFVLFVDGKSSGLGLSGRR